MRRIGSFVLGLAAVGLFLTASPAYSEEETIIEKHTFEERQMKVETVPPPAPVVKERVIERVPAPQPQVQRETETIVHKDGDDDDDTEVDREVDIEIEVEEEVDD